MTTVVYVNVWIQYVYRVVVVVYLQCCEWRYGVLLLYSYVLTSVYLYLCCRDDLQCREKWMNGLDPTRSPGHTVPFSEQEDIILVKLLRRYGPGQWSHFAQWFPRRIDSDLYVRYNQLEGNSHINSYITLTCW